MARHFKETPTERTAPMRRAAPRRVETRDTAEVRLPYGQAASYQYDYGRMAPTDDYFDETYVPARGGFFAFLRGVIMILAVACRLAAIFLFLIVTMHVLGLPVLRGPITQLTDTITGVLPWGSLSAPVIDTPFGGVFRIDIALMCLLLFILDWLFCKLRANVR